MFLGFRKKRLETVISYSPLAKFLYYFTNLPLLGENIPSPIIKENKQNSNPNPLLKWGRFIYE